MLGLLIHTTEFARMPVTVSDCSAEVFAATDVPFVPMDVKAGAEDYVQALDGTPPNRAQVVRAQLLCRQRVTEAARALAMGW